MLQFHPPPQPSNEAMQHIIVSDEAAVLLNNLGRAFAQPSSLTKGNKSFAFGSKRLKKYQVPIEDLSRIRSFLEQKWSYCNIFHLR